MFDRPRSAPRARLPRAAPPAPSTGIGLHMLDLVVVAGTIAIFALLGLLVKGADSL
ncbi:hypothetical protein OVA14_04870 [Agrococcus sp. SL85]|uniref:hypothetical protein n=1 Tax=Agrococcus sp. SL85 TaxID=2995141 RepID=UPI00226D2A61|nr:hypothetical protein [Agrococcus sp. SL85]WAC67087.1 hypothetical protein OVA14_04870 [Agrococcus sp. SL85]